MSWADVPAVVAGVPLPKSSYLDVVTADLNLLGQAWTDDTRATTSIWTTSGAAIGNGTLLSRYRLAGKTLDWLVILTLGSTSNAGAGQFTFTYPAGVSPANPGALVSARLFDNSVPTTYLAAGVLNAATVNLDCITSAAGVLSTVNSTSPMTWAASDVCAFLLTGCEVS